MTDTVKAHDWKETTWQHLNFFQHLCFISARGPRVTCPTHGVLRVRVPWDRPDSGFTLVFEQAALIIARDMPVAAAARIIGIADKRLWRVIGFSVARARSRLDLSGVVAVAVDETTAKRRHAYVTVFIDLDRKDKPVLFVTPGKGKETIARLEGLNGLFQAARARARGYRKQTTFATVIYLIAAPLGELFDVSEST